MPATDIAVIYAQAMRLHQAGRLADAVTLYNRILAAAPAAAGIYGNLAIALASLGRHGEAEAALRTAIGQTPQDAELHLGLGFVLLALRRKDDAIAAYRQAIVLKPDLADAHFQLGSVLSENGHIAEGFEHYMRRAALVWGSGKVTDGGQTEPAHKTKHDREQQEFLAGKNIVVENVNSTFVLEDGGRIAGPAVNPANMTADLLEKWRSSSPQFVILEDFLMPQALEKLRRYCAGSTIWRRIYAAGYLGAPPEDGLACPLLAQIAEELQDTYKAMLGEHPFRYLGAFKYDSTLSTGTNIHADNSAVNVNFYIAPDEANNDPLTGGMDIWDVAMPPDVDMRKYNGDEAAAVDLLKRSNARKHVVPHRANRAVIFRSDLFHKTGDCHFKEGYLNKRINVSLLFGDRGAPTR